MEVWKNVDGYKGLYQVSNLGDIKSLDKIVKCKGNNTRISKGKILKQIIKKTGYSQVVLYKNNIRKYISTHRIVAQAFIPNPNNKSCVNHIDGNKLNNNISNLEWCTHIENMNHAWQNGLVVGKKVLMESLNNIPLLCFFSVKDAYIYLNKNYKGGISGCCNGYQKSAYGYKWKYIKERN